MYFIQKLKFELAVSANKILGNGLVERSDFEYPPADVSGADLALPCFKYAKEMKKSPAEIAGNISDLIKNRWLEKAEARGAYINFYLKRNAVAEKIIKGPEEQNTKDYVDAGKNKKVMLEYVSPNSNKPLHLGHLRNAFLGETLANILDFTGHKVTRSCLINDRGVAICKVMLAYKKWGRGDSPKKSKLKPDHFVGKYYVMLEDKKSEAMEKEVQELLKKWEEGDRETVALWKKMQKWAMEGYGQTYKKLDIEFDRVYFESELYKGGKEMAEEYLKKKKFSKDEKGNIIVKLAECNLPDKVVLRHDGTAVYATTDLALAKKRIDEGFKKVYYVVGSEQDLYFKQLFCMFKNIGLSGEFSHLSYGLVELPEGRMKSREGTVVDADDLLEKMEGLARAEIKKRNKNIKKRELDKRAKAISSAAIRFYILNVNPATKIKFNPKESISFTGKTGPYLLYSYARLRSILRKGKVKDSRRENIDYSLIGGDAAWNLIWALAKFPEAVLSAMEGMDPEEISAYLYNLSTKISDFYHKIPVLEAKPRERQARVAVINSALVVLKAGLLILGIKPLEEM